MARILVVDDEPDVGELVQAILAGDGHEVEVATDGRAALAQVLSDPPDLLVLDIMMPGMDGFQVLRLIRADERTAELPVLILSARTAHADQIGSLQLRASAYVCKPFSPRELIAEVRSVLGGRRA